MKNIVVARVDDRLIHGQVVTEWIPGYNANRVAIVDDIVAKDAFNIKLIKLLAPSGVKVDVYSVADGIAELTGEAKPSERIVVLTKTPITFDRLSEGGVELKDVVLGGMGLRGERKPFVKNVSCSPDEIDSIRNMVKRGIHVFYQLVPDQRAIEITDLI